MSQSNAPRVYFRLNGKRTGVYLGAASVNYIYILARVNVICSDRPKFRIKQYPFYVFREIAASLVLYVVYYVLLSLSLKITFWGISTTSSHHLANFECSVEYLEINCYELSVETLPNDKYNICI